jgi:hypothetical protein
MTTRFELIDRNETLIERLYVHDVHDVHDEPEDEDEQDDGMGGMKGHPLRCHTCKEDQPIIALGPVVNVADPTQTYRLSCGHLES